MESSNYLSAVTLHVQLTIADAGSAKNAAGAVWVQFGETHFPEKGWTDFPVVVLGWWAEALAGLLSSTAQNASASLLFMEGAFRIHLRKVPHTLTAVATLEQHQRKGEGSFNIAIVAFAHQLQRAILGLAPGAGEECSGELRGVLDSNKKLARILYGLHTFKG